MASQTKKSIIVQAGQELAWEAIISYRESQPHRRKILSVTPRGAIVEESFTGLPMVGSSRVVYEEIEYAFDRLEFQKVEADHISMFQGVWTVVARSDGTSDVQLIVEFDVDIEIPFKDAILSQLAEMDISKRLDHVKRTAEHVTTPEQF